MKVLLISPPHTNPVGPTLGIAVLSAHLREKFPNDEIAAMDLGLDAMEWLISQETIDIAKNKLASTIKSFEDKKSLIYEEQKKYTQVKSALSVLEAYGALVEDEIEKIKQFDLYKDDAVRNRANFIINNVLESIGHAWPITQLNAGDYRTDLSPFCLSDIETYVSNNTDSIYNCFFDEWIDNNNISNIDVIGLSISFAKQILPAFLLASKLKKSNHKLTVVIGGSMMAHLNIGAFKPLFKWCDYIIQREGEYPLERLLECIKMGNLVDEHTGVIYVDQKGKLVAPEQMPKVNLDMQPTPDFSGFRLKDYWVPSPNVPLQIGRSCYWGKCTFCCLNAAFAHKKSWTHVNKIVDDIEKMITLYSVKTIEFVDDAIHPFFAREMSKEIIRRKIEIKWFGYARFENEFDKELLSLMRTSGCVGLKFGLESASPRVLRLMNKGVDMSIASRVFKDAYDVGIIPQAAFFFGFPGEQLDDINITFDFLEKSVFDFGIVAYNGKFRLLNSMPLLKEASKYGIENIKKWNSAEELIDYYEVKTITTQVTNEDIKKIELAISKKIRFDLTRSVDMRRYWFAGYVNSASGFNESVVCESVFPLDEIKNMQDKRNGDFLPGQGIYADKSYISDGMHLKEISMKINELLPIIKSGESHRYVYNIKDRSYKKG